MPPFIDRHTLRQVIVAVSLDFTQRGNTYPCKFSAVGFVTAIAFAASQGTFELKAFMPGIIYDFLQSVRLLSDGMNSFATKCVDGIEADEGRMKRYVSQSLMLVTALNDYIGHERAGKVATTAYETGTSLREACVKLGYLSGEEFDKLVLPENMI